MSPVAVAVTHTSWCQCELPAYLCPECDSDSCLGTLIISTFIHAGKMGMEKLDPPGAMCSNPPPHPPPGVALEATLDHYSPIRDRAGDLPAPLYLKESSAAGWLEGPFDIPTRMNSYLLNSQPL